MSARTREDYERDLSRLVGRSIRNVSYFELDVGSSEPLWNRLSDSYDSLDFGFEWRLDDDSLCSCIWGWEFAAHDVSISFAKFEELESAKRWDVTDHWRARGLLENRIVKVEVTWLRALADETRIYPQSVCVRFSAGASIVLSVFEAPSTVNADHITVFFDETEAHSELRPRFLQ